jgi:acyl-[acyl carrier protein]--UDP-N-acetylglucosamine O-acyltransferase
MPSKIVLGIDPWLSLAMDDWRLVEPATRLIPIEVKLDKNYFFVLPDLDEYESQDVTGFVAWGPEFLNFQRLELFGELKKRGYRLPPLIHPSAQVSTSAKIHENVWLQAISYIGPNSIIEMNSCICTGALIGSSVIIKKNTWIGQCSKVKNTATVGSHTFLGDGVTVNSNLLIGKQVHIDNNFLIEKNIPDKNFRLKSSNLIGKIIKL